MDGVFGKDRVAVGRADAAHGPGRTHGGPRRTGSSPSPGDRRTADRTRQPRRTDERPPRRCRRHPRTAGRHPRRPRRTSGRHYCAAYRTRTTGSGPDDEGGKAYRPIPAPRRWQITGAERDQAIAQLRAWVEQIYLSGYSYLAAMLSPRWEQHPLCLYLLNDPLAAVARTRQRSPR